tara:strand:+ start:118 stop:687 length:570 start_codon:yes stop_codon:yes gene_type:complete
MSTQATTTINGVDVEGLGALIEKVRQNPALGQCRFRASNTWISGPHNRTSMQGFYASGEEDQSREEPIVLDSDVPPFLLGENRGATPLEIALTALASCMTGTLVAYGSAMGIELEEVSAELESDLDQRGFFDIDASVRNGLQHVRVDYRIQSPEPRERILELLGVAQKFSPVFDIMTNPVPVSIRLVEA